MNDNQRLGPFLERIRRMSQAGKAPFPVRLRKALAAETGLSEEDLRQLAPGLLDGEEDPSD